VTRRLVRKWKAHHLYYSGDLDLAVREFLSPAVRVLLAEKLIDRFFFVRYTLGGLHLRLRYRLVAEGRRAESAVEELLQASAAEFLARWRAEGPRDEEAIRAESRAILAVAPEVSELCYEDNRLLRSTFEPEAERYGGWDLLGSSLDFFVLSSLRACTAIADPIWSISGRRGALTLRLLFAQALGFCRTAEELALHLGYRLPVAMELVDAIWQKADRDFSARREIYEALLFQEAQAAIAAGQGGGEGARPTMNLLYEAARSLSQVVASASRQVRWQVGHSQLHMTANRLGFFPPQEMHLQRILGRTASSLADRGGEPWHGLLHEHFQRTDAGVPPLQRWVEDHLLPRHRERRDCDAAEAMLGSR
jgi:hypothetical protein